MGSSLGQLAYEESLRALDRQERALESLRTRGAALVTVAAGVTTFLAPRSMEASHLGRLAVAGLVLFGLAVLCGVLILVPYNFTFTNSPNKLVIGSRDNEDLEEWYCDLALLYRDYRRENQGTINRLWSALSIGGLLLLADVLVWTLAVHY